MQKSIPGGTVPLVLPPAWQGVQLGDDVPHLLLSICRSVKLGNVVPQVLPLV